jgi:hypothetical protein
LIFLTHEHCFCCNSMVFSSIVYYNRISYTHSNVIQCMSGVTEHLVNIQALDLILEFFRFAAAIIHGHSALCTERINGPFTYQRYR